jgi:maleate cis-trans isomerase
LKHFGVSRIALATRWSDAVNTALIAYLKLAGIEVLAHRQCLARACQGHGFGRDSPR